ncbi:hypothetical protein M430DRAFT_150302 [Amorphotheca resinae ATCC 22711]|uniref:Uncharacterized protein n=1 Tax=Amorphotheca resinae ATCC 22711 TaxID=857342 RepID=A0A2T3BCK4_AMORE|nr:hypothetical protein M430DRAFT_150302 [Amorphotheca resinae ATCC 22711]PSS27140.1 hypothetical protein M430DRAFT_150302 [Amorphotheca resinae ATCC 22711]
MRATTRRTKDGQPWKTWKSWATWATWATWENLVLWALGAVRGHGQHARMALEEEAHRPIHRPIHRPPSTVHPGPSSKCPPLCDFTHR